MASELKRGLGYSDLQVRPDDAKRYELVRGGILVTPSPSPQHQRISKRLQRQLEAFFETRSLGEVFNAPIDLILTEQDVFVPVLLVVCDPSHISKRGIEAPPALVVEILSPSTRARDRGLKARRYAELGVEHYWIVDPGRRRLECHRLAEGRIPAARGSGGRVDARAPGVGRSRHRPGCALALSGADRGGRRHQQPRPLRGWQLESTLPLDSERRWVILSV